MPSPASSVWVICEQTDAGSVNLVEAHTTSRGALAAAEKLKSITQVKELELKKAKKEADSEGDKAKMPKRASNDDADEVGEVVKPKGVDWEENAMPGSLRGLKLLFTGKMDKKRSECENIAKKYGAEIAKKVDDADYVVMGDKPGDAKIAVINQKGIETTDQAGFRFMLESGEAPSTQQQAVNAPPPTKKQKR